jgi:hypothetical protein
MAFGSIVLRPIVAASVLPLHRLISKRGKVVGFCAGWGRQFKKCLLELGLVDAFATLTRRDTTPAY